MKKMVGGSLGTSAWIEGENGSLKILVEKLVVDCQRAQLFAKKKSRKRSIHISYMAMNIATL